MSFKKVLLTITSVALLATSLVACGANNSTTDVSKKDITVISREEGSGTRGAFIELTGVQEKDASGKKIDKTTKDAIIANGTDNVLTQVAGNDAAIGYISLGSLNDTVKALKVDGVEATSENVKNGSYKVQRPFNIATKGTVSEVSQDFIDYIMSKDGQDVIGKSYIPAKDGAAAYAGKKPTGNVVVAGSTSVGPIMEKLAEAYMKVNTNAKVTVQQTDSTAGMKATTDGTCDIGMSSRELTDSEKSTLTPLEIAKDGIAIIVNKANTLSDATKDMLKNIYNGTTTKWADVK